MRVTFFEALALASTFAVVRGVSVEQTPFNAFAEINSGIAENNVVKLGPQPTQELQTFTIPAPEQQAIQQQLPYQVIRLDQPSVLQ